MKRLNAILVLTVLAACCSSCKKDPDNVQIGQIRIEEKERQFVKEDEILSVELSATCYYSGIINRITLRMSLSEDFSETHDVNAVKVDGAVQASFPVIMDTVYYYRYVVHRYSTEFGLETEWVDNEVYKLSTCGVRLPSVTTNDVRFVTSTHALGWGTVTDDYDEVVTQRGICWSTQAKPGLGNNHDVDGAGMGDCYVQMNGLSSETYYYVRAYAKNRFGVSYGNEAYFKTQSIGYLSVETMNPTNVKEKSVTLKGKLSLSNGSVFSAGFLFGLTPNTIIAESVGVAINYWGSNTYTKIFSKTISGLDNDTEYYVRAFAINTITNDTLFGEMKSFSTKTSPIAPAGELNGAFSVSPTQQVQFSPGNLQYQASTNKWRFAHQQWEYIGEDNKNLSATYYGWIDLFGWGTSGHDHGAVCYQPWSSSYNNSDYYAYGGYDYSLNDQTGLADWGSNTIFLSDETTEGWRSLTSNEWNYLFNTRSTSSRIRYAKAQLNIVNGTDVTTVNGMIIFPDDWIDNGLIYQPNTPEASYSSNIIFASDWKEEYESKGAVFLPAAGRRSGSHFYEDNRLCGYYWSASKFDSRVSHLYFYEDGFGVDYLSSRYYGHSVRLVRDNN